jgi:uncharacterized protein YqjF (DUF2071 family)
VHSSLRHVDHRPWPLPNHPWRWRQSWCDLLFAHWTAPESLLRPLIPAALELDRIEGELWLGLVPFRMAGVMHRPLPDFPGLSVFPEINVRTYVRHGAKPGVFFFSLDASNRIAVWAARRFFHLPYHHADMQLERSGDELTMRSVRRSNQAARLEVGYRPTSPVRMAEPGTLEWALTERYCLYAAAPDGSLWRTEVHHPQWPLQDASADFGQEGLLRAAGFAVSGPPRLLHFADRVDVVAWSPTRVED